MSTLYDVDAPKKAANLSINSDLLRMAKALDVNLSASVEQALEMKVREKLSERWIKENQDAINAYNAHVEQHGVFSDGLRSF